MVAAYLFCVACVGCRFAVGLQISVLDCCLNGVGLVLVMVCSFVLVVVVGCDSVFWCKSRWCVGFDMLVITGLIVAGNACFGLLVCLFVIAL